MKENIKNCDIKKNSDEFVPVTFSRSLTLFIASGGEGHTHDAPSAGLAQIGDTVVCVHGVAAPTAHHYVGPPTTALLHLMLQTTAVQLERLVFLLRPEKH